MNYKQAQSISEFLDIQGCMHMCPHIDKVKGICSLLSGKVSIESYHYEQENHNNKTYVFPNKHDSL